MASVTRKSEDSKQSSQSEQSSSVKNKLWTEKVAPRVLLDTVLRMMGNTTQLEQSQQVELVAPFDRIFKGPS